MSYVPAQPLLERYAELLVGYALGDNDGIAPDDVVIVSAPETAKPLYVELCKAIWRAGGHVLSQYQPDDGGMFNGSRDFFEIASDHQLDFFQAQYRRGMIDQADHLLYIACDADPHALRDVDPAKLLRYRRSRHPFSEWQDAKESAGKFTWTIALYGTEGMAAEAGLSIEAFWQQIFAACFLEDPDPIGRWREVNATIAHHAGQLNALPIDRLHVEGADVDLWITLGDQRRWIGGGGRNIPSFEVFTSPDWRGTEGRIRFSEPLYAYGSLITGIELEFAGGRVIRATAEQNQPLLAEIIGVEGSDRIGEFSLTDARLSPITMFMANTLFDENVGGPFGNTHIAVGQALHPCYAGDPATVAADEWARLGFNESAVHTDIVSTSDRTVTATLRGASSRIIYAGGQFTLDDG